MKKTLLLGVGMVLLCNASEHQRPSNGDDRPAKRPRIEEGVERFRRWPKKQLNNRLLQAVKQGNASRVEALLAAGADVNAKEEDGSTVLISAVLEGSKEIISMLLTAGADVRVTFGGENVLMIASKLKDEGIVCMLLAFGAHTIINAVDRHGTTPLMMASFEGSENIVKVLLAAGAEVHIKNDIGSTALLEALRGNKKVPVVRRLLAAGSDPNVVLGEEGTPLMIVAYMGSSDALAIAQLLLDYNADINWTDKNGWSVLMTTAAEGNEAMVKLLFENNAAPPRSVEMERVNLSDEARELIKRYKHLYQPYPQPGYGVGG